MIITDEDNNENAHEQIEELITRESKLNLLARMAIPL